MQKPRLVTMIVVAVVAACNLAGAGEEPKPKEEGPQPIRLDRENRILEIDGRICLAEGPLELFACAEGGKEYESVIALEGEPWRMHLMLLVMGLKPGGGPEYQGDPKQPWGDTAVIEVRWEADGNAVRKRAEELILDIKTEKPMPQVEWVFIGSKFEKNPEGKDVYAANRDKSIITVFHDPYTVFDNPLPTGGDDTNYVVNTKVVPPLDTKVTLIITPGKNPIPRPKEPDPDAPAEPAQ